MTYTAVQWVFFFYFYCFFGWCFESTYVSLLQRKWVNRGFMKGPFLPLYGSGAIMMLVVSRPFLEHWWAVYIAGCIGATVLEYVTGVAMEALFKVRYWDYSNQRFQFQGHICLSSSLAWGGLTLLMNYVIQFQVERLIFAIPGRILVLATALITVYIVGDFVLSFKEAMDLRDILVKMEKGKENLLRVQKRLDVILAVAGEELSNKREAFAEGVGQRKDAIVESLEQTKDSIAESLEQRKDAIVESLEQTKDSIAESLEQRKDAIAESLVQTKDSIAGSLGQTKDSIAGSLGQKKDAIAESLGQYKDALAGKLRVEEIKESIERSLATIKDSVRRENADYSEDTREEILDLHAEYKLNKASREDLGNSKSLMRRIRNNPTMSSSKYQEALDELKQKTAGRKKK